MFCGCAGFEYTRGRGICIPGGCVGYGLDAAGLWKGLVSCRPIVASAWVNAFTVFFMADFNGAAAEAGTVDALRCPREGPEMLALGLRLYAAASKL